MKARVLRVVVPALALVGCQGVQNALAPAGPHAARIAELTRFMLITMTVIYVVVIGALLIGLRRGRGREPNPAADDPRLTRVVAIAVGLTAVYLVGLFVYDLLVNRQVHALQGRDVFTIQVTGRQWWWDFAYGDTVDGTSFRTANELHIPVGRTIRLRMTAADVIHSFWVPNLNGKRDLFPDRSSELYLRADSAGVYRGQCAEFCGPQHANMALMVVAEEEREFRSWYTWQQSKAAVPTDSLAREGQRVFEQGSCALCHTVRGTSARGTVAPDLTHFASRRQLGAGVLKNSRGNVGGWVLDPQSIKPHVNMPPNPLAPEQLKALLAYLESLQ